MLSPIPVVYRNRIGAAWYRTSGDENITRTGDGFSRLRRHAVVMSKNKKKLLMIEKVKNNMYNVSVEMA